ncbi:MAG: hypothetical protein E6Q88_08875 [Lysobacteraceae bacterium]|nr:MAG: hypothetical protein E6Q88_08875 [Xanthomonadaceae bacterium]
MAALLTPPRIIDKRPRNAPGATTHFRSAKSRLLSQVLFDVLSIEATATRCWRRIRGPPPFFAPKQPQATPQHSALSHSREKRCVQIFFYDPSFGQDRMSIDDIFDGFSIDASYADSAAIAKEALFDTPMTSLQ